MNNLKEKAQHLRQERGLTASEIANVLKKPTSTIGRWITGIDLTKEQQLALSQRLPTYRRGKFAAQFYSENCKYLRDDA
jgi:transcriptional regulator with XRE-family HTH domain